jgi:hypothetical protein
LHERIHLAQFFGGEVFLGLEIPHCPAEAGGKGADVERGDGPDAALAFENVLPGLGYRAAHGRHDAKTGDYDTPLGQALTSRGNE